MATADSELPHPQVSTRGRGTVHPTSSPEEPPEPEIRKTEGSRYVLAALASIGCFSHPSYFPEVQHGYS